MTLIQDLHAAISRRDWHAVEVAANRLRDANLEADNAAKDARIKELEGKLDTATALVTCCCGDPVDAHNLGSGHSPVDQYHYAMMQLEAKLAVMREALSDLVSWFSDPSEYGPWIIKSGKHGADDAVEHARAVLGGKPS